MQTSLRLAQVVEAHDDPDEAYKRIQEFLAGCSDLRAVYVGTANSMPFVRALEEKGATGTNHCNHNGYLPVTGSADP